MMEKLTLTLQEEFRKMTPDSHHILVPLSGPIAGIRLLFDTRLESSTRVDMQTMVLDIHLFNTGSPHGTFEVIAAIQAYFSNRVLYGSDYVVKFPRGNPIASQQTVDMETSELHRIDLMITAKIYYNAYAPANGPDGIQITRF